MRLALFVHGLPPHERTGVETHVAALAETLASKGTRVLVVAPRRDPRLPHLSMRRERRGDVDVHWLNLLHPPADLAEREEPPGVGEELGRWLERERPDLVDVHHWSRFGLRFPVHCRGLGIPAVYTAHDFHFACHRWTLLRPDLSRCPRSGDPELCARCDLAQEHLEGLGRLGDFQLGVLPGQLDAAERGHLARCLEGDAPDLPRVLARRRELHAARARALESFHAVFAPTETVALALLRAGVRPERVRLVASGIDTRDLERVPPPLPIAAAPLRLGFIGGLSKHKGVHVLLEAFRGLAGRATLDLFGGSTDGPYVEHARRLCEEVGARYHGAFEARDLPRVLARVDVVCVPSLWEENAPFVIREAFAAGRPVLASRTEALAESVRDGIDGLLLPQGDAAAWRRALVALAEDRPRVRELAGNVRAPRTLAEHADDLLERYELVLEQARAARREPLPPHLERFDADWSRLGREPLDALYARVRAGLSGLRTALTGARAATGAGDRTERDLEGNLEENVARDLLRDARGRIAWLESREARRAAEVGWQKEQLDARQEELAWRRELLAQRDRELEWLRGTVAGLTEERDALAQARAEAERALAEAARQLEALRAGTAEGAEREAALAEELSALARHEAWLRGEAAALAALVAGVSPPQAPDPRALEAQLASARARAEAARAELAWRREEMGAALRDGGGLFKSLLDKSALGRRLAGWAQAEEAGS